MNGGEVARQALFLEIAKSVSEKPSCFRTALAYMDKIKFSMILCSDVILAFTILGTDWNNTLEGIWCLVQYFVACLFVFSVATYSSSGRCLTCDFFMIAIGIYNVQWKLRKERNDQLHRLPVVVPYVEANSGGCYRRFNRAEVWSVTALCVNDLVDAKLEFTYTISAELLMAVAKIVFLFDGSTNACSISNVWNILVVIIALCGPIKAIVAEELETMKFLKIFNLLDAYDQADFNDFKCEYQTTMTKYLTVLYHTISLGYRVFLISFFFQISIGVGISFVVTLLVLSIVRYKLVWARPIYENAPVGAPTRCYAILEVICGIFTTRHHRISSSSFFKQIGSILVFITIKVFENFVLLFVLTKLYGIYEPFYKIEPQVFGPCDSRFYNALSSALSIFSVSFGGEDSFQEIVLKHKLLLGSFLLYIFYSIAFYLYLHFAGLNDDRFPAHTAIHIWSDKFLNKRWSRVHHDWIVKMMFYTLSDSSLKKLRKLPDLSKAITDSEIKPYMREVRHLQTLPACASAFKTELLEDHPLSEQLGALVDHLYRVQIDPAVSLGLCYKFCASFEDRMKYMSSYRIACICDLLGESPVVQSDFTDDPIADAWYWFFM